MNVTISMKTITKLFINSWNLPMIQDGAFLLKKEGVFLTVVTEDRWPTRDWNIGKIGVLSETFAGVVPWEFQRWKAGLDWTGLGWAGSGWLGRVRLGSGSFSEKSWKILKEPSRKYLRQHSDLTEAPVSSRSPTCGVSMVTMGFLCPANQHPKSTIKKKAHKPLCTSWISQKMCQQCLIIMQSCHCDNRINKPFACSRCVICVSCSVHVISTYYARKGS